jgi:ferric-dicitrate binding protein FerR (iron transport regulator)
MTDPRISSEAAHWLIELDTAEETGTLWPDFEAWLGQGDEHRRAYARVERAWRTLEDLRHLYSVTNTTQPRHKALSSTVIIVAIVAALATALAVLG